MIKAEEAKRREEEKTMRSIIQSINPEHVYNMHVEQEGEPLKRIEVRKTAPPTPLKFLYMEDVIFYDKPKELGEFRGVCGKRCINCNYKKYIDGLCDECGTYKLIRPPQSWCYAEA